MVIVLILNNLNLVHFYLCIVYTREGGTDSVTIPPLSKKWKIDYSSVILDKKIYIIII
jgi:hypothetical protein